MLYKLVVKKNNLQFQWVPIASKCKRLHTPQETRTTGIIEIGNLSFILFCVFFLIDDQRSYRRTREDLHTRLRLRKGRHVCDSCSISICIICIRVFAWRVLAVKGSVLNKNQSTNLFMCHEYVFKGLEMGLGWYFHWSEAMQVRVYLA